MFSRHWFRAIICAVLLTVGAPAWAERFTVAVVPDTQNYADVTLPQPRGEETFVRQMQYLADTREEKKLAFVTFVGDIVQHGDGRFREQVGTKEAPRFRAWDSRAEWDIATHAVSILGRAAIPFGLSPGNHDYDNYSWWEGENGPGASRPLSGGRVWELYFGPQSRHFADKSWYGGSFNHGLNSYQRFTGGGQRFLHLSLEMQPTPAALAWAQGVIDANPGLPVIVTTHEWLVPALAASSPARSNGYQAYFAGTDHLPPDEVRNRFIAKNAQIFMILSGHNWTPTVDGMSQGENLRIDRNEAGYPVYQILQDYQGNTVGPDGVPGSANGGSGWLRFMEFDTERRKIHFYTYSPLLDRYAGRNGERTFGAEPRYSDFELDFPQQLLR